LVTGKPNYGIPMKCRIRDAPVPSATMACTRGPNLLGGPPASNDARVGPLRAGQTNQCSGYSITTGVTRGNSVP
jgi:hypothetical protein